MRARTSSPLQQATERAILQRLQEAKKDGRTLQLAGLVRNFRGDATAAQVRNAVEALAKTGIVETFAWKGHIFVRLPKGGDDE